MKIRVSALRKIIRETLLVEELISKTSAVVYHGSWIEPEKFVDMLARGEWKPNAERSRFGHGLYTFFDKDEIKPDHDPLEGSYGPYVYKLRINPKGYVALTGDVAQGLYGKPLLPSEQVEMLAYRPTMIKSLKRLEARYRISGDNFMKFDFERAGEDILEEFGSVLSGLVKGIIYRDSNGLVAIVSDPSTAVPIEWIRPVGEEYEVRRGLQAWTRFKPLKEPAKWQSIKSASVKSLEDRLETGEFEEEKYEDPDRTDTVLYKLSKLPVKDRIVNGDLNLYANQDVEELPAGLKVMGNLDLGASSIKSLPRDLEVKKNLRLYNCKDIKSLPDNLNVGGDLDLTGFCSVKKLPRGLKVGKNLNLNSNIKTLPDDLQVGKKIYDFSGDMEEVPSHLRDKTKYKPLHVFK